MAHKKGEGSTSNGRDSNSKRLGVKLFGGQGALAGAIIIRQRGTKFHAGENVYMGKDYTLHAAIDGTVAFQKGRMDRTFVSIIPFEEVAETIVKEKPLVAKATPAPKPKVEKAAETVVEKPVKAKKEKVAEVKEEKKAVAKTAPAKKEEATEKAAAPKKAAKAGKDDLKKVEGVGPKIASLLTDAGINTFAELAATDADKIREILEAAGSRYKMHDPTTWPQQAALAAEGKWDELAALQHSMKGGRTE